MGVFDAEDIVHPDLLNRINARSVSTGSDIVQGGVQLMNVGTNWFSARNVLKYDFYSGAVCTISPSASSFPWVETRSSSSVDCS